jgi:V/A-type H+/Na+-transporting ATPase subunit D
MRRRRAVAEILTTRSAALALADERALMRQGYQFLDEKRMLLAAEMLRALARHQALEDQLRERLLHAQQTLRQALQRHGLDGLQAYPPTAAPRAEPRLARSRFLGVPLLAAELEAQAPSDDGAALDASPEALACAQAFAALLGPLAALAAAGGNLERLGSEYSRSQRRARALENVLLPEIEASLKTIEEHLERADQEDALRVRMAHAGPAP